MAADSSQAHRPPAVLSSPRPGFPAPPASLPLRAGWVAGEDGASVFTPPLLS